MGERYYHGQHPLGRCSVALAGTLRPTGKRPRRPVARRSGAVVHPNATASTHQGLGAPRAQEGERALALSGGGAESDDLAAPTPDGEQCTGRDDGVEKDYGEVGASSLGSVETADLLGVARAARLARRSARLAA